MKLYSTGNPKHQVSFLEAVLNAYPEDKGLYFPLNIPKGSPEFFDSLHQFSFVEIATYISQLWLGDEIPALEIRTLCEESFNFEVPLLALDEKTYILELFQGPTMAFKDFGARFMAKILEFALKNSKRKVVVLTATSGDTGGAVASGFSGIESVEVVILFPEGKVSPIQRKQLTTLGSNIHALSVRGNFDDCQRLVKEALLDPQVRTAAQFCSANSINIARLLPQSFYYFYAESKFRKMNGNAPDPVLFSVPSGNFGNLTAGLFAWKMGLPVIQFLAATNENDSVPQYLRSGQFLPHPSWETLATAMDVGNPSNFIRLQELFDQDYHSMGKMIKGRKVGDQEIKTTIREVFRKSNYILDPHTAVGVKGLMDFKLENPEYRGINSIVLGTAHPSKFTEIVEKELEIPLDLPPQLKKLINKTEQFSSINPNFEELKQFLLEKVLFLNS